jgi:hypothetical protein
MSYYILPKIDNEIIVNPISCIEPIKPYISHSVISYYYDVVDQITKTYLNENIWSYRNFNDIIHIVHPYEYVYSTIPGSKFAVSKIKANTNLFYDFFEISKTLNIFDGYKKDISMLHITNNNDTVKSVQLLRENWNDSIELYDDINEETIRAIGENKYDFIFFETKTTNLNNYIVSFIEILIILLKNQSCEGSCIIKIKETFHKPIIDILYLLSSLYDKIHILKPHTSNIISFDKYVICSNFSRNSCKKNVLKLNYVKLVLFLKKLNCTNIKSILDIDISYFFITKLNDTNVILCQQQLEALDYLINIFSKKKEEKLDNIRKINIQKSIVWCEKYKIPCNRFIEKTNIFLPINKDLIEDIECMECMECMEDMESTEDVENK